MICIFSRRRIRIRFMQDRIRFENTYPNHSRKTGSENINYGWHATDSTEEKNKTEQYIKIQKKKFKHFLGVA